MWVSHQTESHQNKSNEQTIPCFILCKFKRHLFVACVRQYENITTNLCPKWKANTIENTFFFVKRKEWSLKHKIPTIYRKIHQLKHVFFANNKTFDIIHEVWFFVLTFCACRLNSYILLLDMELNNAIKSIYLH